jgi:Helix-turn-helix
MPPSISPIWVLLNYGASDIKIGYPAIAWHDQDAQAMQDLSTLSVLGIQLCFDKTDGALNFRHLKQISRLRNVFAHSGQDARDEFELTLARKRLGLTQEQMAKALDVAPPRIQDWEGWVRTSQMAKKIRDLKEPLQLMDDIVIAPKELEWLHTPPPAIRNQTPIHAIIRSDPTCSAKGTGRHPKQMPR